MTELKWRLCQILSPSVWFKGHKPAFVLLPLMVLDSQSGFVWGRAVPTNRRVKPMQNHEEQPCNKPWLRKRVTGSTWKEVNPGVSCHLQMQLRLQTLFWLSLSNRIHRIRHPRETYMACLNSGFATGFQIDISKMCASCTCWLDILVATHCKPKLRPLIRGLDWRFGDLNLFL